LRPDAAPKTSGFTQITHGVFTLWRPQGFAGYYHAMKNDEIWQPEKPASSSRQCLPGPSHRILVVDGEPLMRCLNTKMLVDAGYHVDAAADGAVAWNALQLKCYDLLITDNDMTKVSGVELIEKVRAAGMALPIIMATGASPREQLARLPLFQPAAMMLKPYTPVEFLGTVQEVLRATNGACEQIAPLPYWQSQPSADGLQL
jgi:DNA-binding response OmpR family regulator